MNDDTLKYILGVKISGTSIGQVLTEIEKNVTSGIKFSIMTPNPELVLMAQRNNELKVALNSATFSIPDGVGLKLAIPNLKIIKGRELFLELIKLSDKNSWKVFLLGGLENESLITENVLKNENLKLKIESMGGKDVSPELNNNQINRINSFAPDLLFVAFGNPNQEIFTYKNLNKLNVKGIMGVGGSFNYVSGNSRLPPKIFENLGIEWLWRLLNEPKRIKRIFNATILFPIELIKSKLRI